MKPQDFVSRLYLHALSCEQKTGISAVATLAQCAVESGWGDHAPGNMFFGQKDFDGVNGNEQLIVTFEYNKRGDLSAKQIGLNEIISVNPVLLNGLHYFKYTGRSYFRKYATPADCFINHCRFFFENKRYEQALLVKKNPYSFIDAIAAAGYAQSPTYAATLKSIAKTIEKYISNA